MAKKLSDAQVGYLWAIWGKKKNPMALKQGKRLCEHHLLSMKPAILSDWKASVIAGNCGNSFKADMLKAHLTIISSKVDRAHCYNLLQAMCGKLLMKTSGRPVLTKIDSKLPLAGPSS